MSSNLAISLVIGAAVGGAISGINQIKNTLKSLTDSTQSIGQRMATLNQLSIAGMKSSAASLTALGGSVVALAKPAIEFESAMADVKKVVDFKTPEGFKKLSKDLLDLTHTIPMTGKELAAIAASGGQLGVAEEDITAFTTTIAKMSVAFDMSADQSGEAMAKLANVYKIPISEIGKLGDAINDLSNSSPAKASDIVNTLGRIGGTAKQFGLTENAAAALSNTFISLGKTPEVAGTAINGMLTKLMTAEKGGKAFQGALKKMGISAKQLKKNIAKDGEGAIVDFVKRVEKLPKDQAMGILVDIFGREYADDVAVLAGNTELLEKSLKQLKETDENGNLRYLGSMDKEFNARAATTEASLTKLTNSFTSLAIGIGNYVLPVINDFVSWLQPIIISVTDFINTNTDLMGEIAKWGTYAVGAVAGFSAVIGGLSFLTWGTLKVISVFKMAWSVLSFGGSIIALVSKGILGLVGFIGKLLLPVVLKLAYGFGYLIGWLGKSILFAARLGQMFAGALLKGLLLVGKAIIFVGRAFLANPIGIAVAVIAGLAYLLWDNWDWVSEKFSQMWQWIGEKSTQCGQVISDIWNGVTTFFSGVWENITTVFNSGIGNITATILNWSPLGLFYQAFAGVLSWFGIDLPAKFTEFGSNLISGLVNGIRNAWDGAKEWVIGLGKSIKGWFTGEMDIHSPSRVFKGYGENIVSGLAIGIAENVLQATQAVDKMGKKIKKAAPKTVAAPAIKAPKMPTVEPLVAKSTVKFEPVLNGIETAFKPIFNEKKGLFGSLWDDIKFGANFIGNLLGINQPTDYRTPDFNPNSSSQNSSLFSDYQPLNRNAVTHNETTQNGGIVVNFNPTIHLSGNQNPDSLLSQLQDALFASKQDLARFIVETIRREEDQYRRRAY
ncbi:phage tail tape measure protein [Necropsobacter rosorum]|uniref:phage tail tape measure protein n=1 Tax=Necropsobacter rosorum TaxID=908285 RepID=UPI0005093DAE